MSLAQQLTLPHREPGARPSHAPAQTAVAARQACVQRVCPRAGGVLSRTRKGGARQMGCVAWLWRCRSASPTDKAKREAHDTEHRLCERMRALVGNECVCLCVWCLFRSGRR